MYYDPPFYSLIFMPVSSYQQDLVGMGLELCLALHPVFYPRALQPFPVILISTEIPGDNGATGVNLLPF